MFFKPIVKLFRRRSQKKRYLGIIQQAVQETGPPPSPEPEKKEQQAATAPVVVQVQVPQPAPAPRPASKGRAFARAAWRVMVETYSLIEGLFSLAVWLGLNLVVVLVIVLAARSAGAHLPPWLDALANFVQGLLGRAAHALGV